MSTRAMDFMHRWLHANIDEALDGSVSASEMPARMVADAIKAGIPAEELDDAIRVVEMAFAAMEYRREGP